MVTQITAAGQRLQVLRALRDPNFRWLWLNAATQSMAQGMQFLVLGWLILVLTDSSSQMGLMITLYGVATLSFVLFGGILADRMDRRWLLIITQAAVAVLIFAIATLGVTGLVEVWHIYAIAFILGIVQALNSPTRMAIIADVVEREDLMNAVALIMTVMNSGRIIGPAVAGGIIKLTDTGPALYLNAGLYFLGIMCLLQVKSVSRQRTGMKTTVLGDLLAGLRYFRATPAVLTIVGISFALGFFAMPHMQVMPAFAKKALEVGAGGAGLLLMSAGVGALLGNLILASMGDFQHKGWLLLGLVLTCTISLIIFPWSPWYWVSWFILLFVGAGSMGFVSIGTTLLQLIVPAELQGRVLSLWTIAPGLMFLGAWPMARAAELSSWPAAIGGGAAICLVFVLWLGVWRPTLRQLEV